MGDPELVTQARDLLVKYITDHEESCSAERGECTELANMIAYIAHSLGATKEDMMRVPGLLFKFDVTCKGGEGCKHPRR